MGNQCGCYANDPKTSIEVGDFLGKDDDNVTEDFQIHESLLAYNNTKLTCYDYFYRKNCYPMYLMQIETVWKEIQAVQEEFDKKREDKVLLLDFLNHFK